MPRLPLLCRKKPARTGRPSGNQHRRKTLVFQPLEERRLLAIVSILSTQNTVEGGTPGYFRLTRDTTSGSLTVSYSVDYMMSTAMSGSDYNQLPNSVMFASGQSTVDIVVTPIDDAIAEPNETVRINLQPQFGYTVGSPSSGTVTIADNDSSATVSIATTQDAHEGGDPGYFRLSRSGSTSGSLTVSYTVDMSSSATQGSDYEQLSGSVSFLSGQSTVDIPVSPVDDATVEPNETVKINLAAGSGYLVGTPSNATVTIVDNDVTPVITISSVQDAAEGGPNGFFRLSRTGNPAFELTVGYRVDWTGTAVAGNDYEPLSGIATFPAGEATVDVIVAPIEDSDEESNETVVLTINPPPPPATPPSYTPGTPASATLTITDNDAATSVYILETQDTAEGGQPGYFRLTRSGSPDAVLTVNYTVNSLESTASEGIDFEYLPNSVTFEVGQTVVDIEIIPDNDELAEDDETVRIDLVSDAAYVLGTPASATLTILDDDRGPSVRISALQNTVEGGTPGYFRVTRTGTTPEDLMVFYWVDPEASTASQDSDFDYLSGSVLIPAGQESADILINPVNDNTPEDDEIVSLTLGDGSSTNGGVAAYALGSPSTAVLTISDNDLPPTVTISGLRLVEDTETPDDEITSNPALTGMALVDPGLELFEVEFDHNGDGIVDGAAKGDECDGFVYVPNNIALGGHTIRARGRAWDQTLLEYNYGPWASFTFVLTPVVNQPATIEGFGLLNDTGSSSTDKITADPTLTGRVLNDGSLDLVRVQFDIDGDGQVDGQAVPRSNGTFSYLPDVVPGPVTVRARTYEWDHRTETAIYGPWQLFSFTLEGDFDPRVVVAALALLNDDGTSNTDLVTSDPTLTGHLEDDAEVRYLSVEFDHDDDGIVDGSISADTRGHFVYVPEGLAAGPLTVQARALAWDYIEQTTVAGNWTPLSFTYEPFVNAPPMVESLSLLSDTGASASDSLTANPSIFGTVNNDVLSKLLVEIDHDGDGVRDGFTFTDAHGWFGYTPVGLPYGPATLRVRALEWLHADEEYLAGPWASIDFTHEQQPAAVPLIVELSLANDTGQSDTDAVTYDPTIAGRVSDDGRLDGIVIEFDHDGNGTVEGFATADQWGRFSYLPAGLAAGSVNVSARSREANAAGQSFIYGPWTPFSFTYLGSQGEPPTVADFRLVEDGGASSTDNITRRADLTGEIANDGAVNSLLVEFDHDADGTPEGSTFSDSTGRFVYDPGELVPGSPITLKARAREFDAAGAEVWGPWADLTFTLEVPAPVVVELELTSDTGESDTDKRTSNPSVSGRIDGSVLIGVTIQFEHDTDSNIDGTVTTASGGNFSYVPSIGHGRITLQARAVVTGLDGSDVIGEWATLRFAYSANPDGHGAVGDAGAVALDDATDALADTQSGADADYRSAVRQADAVYFAASSDAGATHASTVADADATFQSSVQAAEDAFKTALASANSSLANALGVFAPNAPDKGFGNFSWPGESPADRMPQLQRGGPEGPPNVPAPAYDGPQFDLERDPTYRALVKAASLQRQATRAAAQQGYEQATRAAEDAYQAALDALDDQRNQDIEAAQDIFDAAMAEDNPIDMVAEQAAHAARMQQAYDAYNTAVTNAGTDRDSAIDTAYQTLLGAGSHPVAKYNAQHQYRSDVADANRDFALLASAARLTYALAVNDSVKILRDKQAGHDAWKAPHDSQAAHDLLVAKATAEENHAKDLAQLLLTRGEAEAEAAFNRDQPLTEADADFELAEADARLAAVTAWAAQQEPAWSAYQIALAQNRRAYDGDAIMARFILESARNTAALTQGDSQALAHRDREVSIATAKREVQVDKSLAGHQFKVDRADAYKQRALDENADLKDRADTLATADRTHSDLVAQAHHPAAVNGSDALRNYQVDAYNRYQTYLSDHDYGAYVTDLQQIGITYRDARALVSKTYQLAVINAAEGMHHARTAADRDYRLDSNASRETLVDGMSEELRQAEVALAQADGDYYARLAAADAGLDIGIADAQWVYSYEVAAAQYDYDIESVDLGGQWGVNDALTTATYVAGEASSYATIIGQWALNEGTAWSTYKADLADAEEIAQVARANAALTHASLVAAQRFHTTQIIAAADLDLAEVSADIEWTLSWDRAVAAINRANAHAAAAIGMATNIAWADTGRDLLLSAADRALRDDQAVRQKTMRDTMGDAGRAQSRAGVDAWYQYVTEVITLQDYQNQIQAINDQRILAYAGSERTWSKAMADARLTWTTDTEDAKVAHAEDVADAKGVVSDALVQADAGWETALASAEWNYTVDLAEAERDYALAADAEQKLHAQVMAGLVQSNRHAMALANADWQVDKATADADYEINLWSDHHAAMQAEVVADPTSLNQYFAANAVAELALAQAQRAPLIARETAIAGANLVLSDALGAADHHREWTRPGIDLALYNTLNAAGYTEIVALADAALGRAAADIVDKYDYRVKITAKEVDDSVAVATAERNFRVDSATAWHAYGHAVADAWHDLRVAKFTSAAWSSYTQLVTTARETRDQALAGLNVARVTQKAQSLVIRVTGVSQAERDLLVGLAENESSETTAITDAHVAYGGTARPAYALHTPAIAALDRTHQNSVAAAYQAHTITLGAQQSLYAANLVAPLAARAQAIAADEGVYHQAHAAQSAAAYAAAGADEQAKRAAALADWLATATPAFVTYRTDQALASANYEVDRAVVEEIHENQLQDAQVAVVSAKAAADETLTVDSATVERGYEAGWDLRNQTYRLGVAAAKLAVITHTADAELAYAIALAENRRDYEADAAQSNADHVFGQGSNADYNTYYQEISDAADARKLADAERFLILVTAKSNLAVQWVTDVTAAGSTYVVNEAAAQTARRGNLAQKEQTRSNAHAVAESTESNARASAKATRWVNAALASADWEIAMGAAAGAFFVAQHTQAESVVAAVAAAYLQDRNVLDLRLLSDTGTSSTDLVTWQPTLVGHVDTSGLPGFINLEFDHDGDGIVDGRAISDAQGRFTYTPLGLPLGAASIRARAIQEDAAGAPIGGDWATFAFTLEADPATAVTASQLALDDDTGSSATDLVTADATLVGQLSAPGGAGGLTVEFDLDGDGAIDGTATTEPDGSFTFAPAGLAQGHHVLAARPQAGSWSYLSLVHSTDTDLPAQLAGWIAFEASRATAERLWAQQASADAVSYNADVAQTRVILAQAAAAAYQSLVSQTSLAKNNYEFDAAQAALVLVNGQAGADQTYVTTMAPTETAYKVQVATLERDYRVRLAEANRDRAAGGSQAAYDAAVNTARQTRDDGLATAKADFTANEKVAAFQRIDDASQADLAAANTLAGAWLVRAVLETSAFETFALAEAQGRRNQEVARAALDAQFAGLSSTAYADQMLSLAQAENSPWATYHSDLAAAAQARFASLADAGEVRRTAEADAELAREQAGAAAAAANRAADDQADAARALAHAGADLQWQLLFGAVRGQLLDSGEFEAPFTLPDEGAPPLADLGVGEALVQSFRGGLVTSYGTAFYGYYDGLGYGYGFYNAFGYGYYGDYYGLAYGGWYDFGWAWYGGFGMANWGGWYGNLYGYGGWYGGYGIGLWWGYGYDGYGLPLGGYGYGYAGWNGGFGEYGLAATAFGSRTLVSWGLNGASPNLGIHHAFVDRVMREYGDALRHKVPESLADMVKEETAFVPARNEDKQVDLFLDELAAFQAERRQQAEAAMEMARLVHNVERPPALERVIDKAFEQTDEMLAADRAVGFALDSASLLDPIELSEHLGPTVEDLLAAAAAPKGGLTPMQVLQLEHLRLRIAELGASHLVKVLSATPRDALDYTLGIAEGFFVDGLAGTAWGLLKLAWNYNAPMLAYRAATGDTFEAERELFKTVANAHVYVAKVSLKVLQLHWETIEAIVTGNDEELNKLGPVWVDAMRLSVGPILDLFEKFVDMSWRDTGRVVGQIVYEVVELVFSFGAAKIAKGAVVAKLAEAAKAGKFGEASPLVRMAFEGAGKFSKAVDNFADAFKKRDGLPSGLPPENSPRPPVPDDLPKGTKGDLAEWRAVRALTRAGYDELPARLPSNNGFDGVFVKRVEGKIVDIIITESKFAKSGYARLSDTKHMGRQLDRRWIDANIEKMRRGDDAAIKETAELLLKNRGLVRTKGNVLDAALTNRWNRLK